MPTLEDKYERLENKLKQAEHDLTRTKTSHNWTSDANLKRIKPEKRAAHVKKLEDSVKKLTDKLTDLANKSRTHGGRRTRRHKHHARKTRRHR